MELNNLRLTKAERKELREAFECAVTGHPVVLKRSKSREVWVKCLTKATANGIQLGNYSRDKIDTLLRRESQLETQLLGIRAAIESLDPALAKLNIKPNKLNTETEARGAVHPNPDCFKIALMTDGQSRQLRYYYRMKAQGRCVECGVKCRGRWCEKHRRHNRRRLAKRYAKDKASGRCVSCSNPAEPGKARCARCLIKYAHYHKHQNPITKQAL